MTFRSREPTAKAVGTGHGKVTSSMSSIDDNGEEVASYEGYRTKEKARLAGEAKMKMLEEKQ